MQTCIFEGRLGSDIEKRMTPQGKSVANVNLAVTKRMKGENKTVWVPLTMWEKTAELAETYLKKGSRILVRTEFDMQEWTDKDGKKRQSPKFTVNEMEFLDSKQSSQQHPNQQYQQPQQNYQDHQVPPSNDDFIESDIPF